MVASQIWHLKVLLFKDTRQKTTALDDSTTLNHYYAHVLYISSEGVKAVNDVDNIEQFFQVLELE